MEALRGRVGEVHFSGVGGDLMQQQGLQSLFPLSDVAVMGPLSILPRLPKIVRRVHQTVDAAMAASPDVVVIIDSPEFTHPIANGFAAAAPACRSSIRQPLGVAWRPAGQRACGAISTTFLAYSIRAGSARATRWSALHLRRPSAGRAPRMARSDRPGAAGPTARYHAG